jgi:hypothetical protein
MTKTVVTEATEMSALRPDQFPEAAMIPRTRPLRIVIAVKPTAASRFLNPFLEKKAPSCKFAPNHEGLATYRSRYAYTLG